MSNALLGRELSSAAKVSIAVALVVSLTYSVIIAGQILLWFYLLFLVVLLVLGVRVVFAFLRLVDAVERIADALERMDAETTERIADALDETNRDSR
ncbi:hypothetical protein [Halopelagius longus]|uniref:Uncharacterized protein n=1 Tax=Halopelagius longus TaxID=1236180 RepID=A0A1H1BKH2_9EURY|nr:hypothetical protein [Halopelagius longus]RDI70822.1 hypothetical protein DWB78_03255 [Halopelagius longus]SDQ52448.1 hypothetical protein SAMN05216278_1839 [Halopelagius longus]